VNVVAETVPCAADCRDRLSLADRLTRQDKELTEKVETLSRATGTPTADDGYPEYGRLRGTAGRTCG